MTVATITPVHAAVTRLRAMVPSRADYAGTRSGWLADLVSGVTVAVVALPLALAFGVASGVGATAGLVTAIVAGAIAAVFGGSHLQVSGPTGAMTIVLAPIVASHGIKAVPTIALMAGMLVVAAGILGLGRLVAFIPWPVVEGFTFGIAVVIAAQQMPMALGMTKPAGNNAAIVAVREVARYAKHPALPVVALLVLTTVLTALLPRLHRALPAGLLAVGIATVLADAMSLHVQRIGALPRGLPTPAIPSLHGAGALVMPAVVVAALASLESVLSARVADGMADLPRHDPNRELFGQGLANVAAGLFSGLPATGALARTAVNARAGARTRLAALIHAIVLAGVMALAAGLVSHIPLVALAGVLLVTAYRMVDRHTVKTVLRSTRTDALVFALTAAATVAFNLVVAVELGIGVAIVVALVKMSNTSRLVVDEETVLEIAPEEEHALLRERVLVYRLDGPLFFAAAARFLDELTAIADVRVVVLRLRNVAMLDATGARAIEQVVEHLDERGIVVIVKVSSDSHLRLLRAVGALDRLEKRGHVHADLTTALQHAREHAMSSSADSDPPADVRPSTEHSTHVAATNAATKSHLTAAGHGPPEP